MTGWMLGNRKRVAKGEESRGEKRKSPGLVQKSKRRGWGGCLNNWELCCGNVDEAGTFFFPPLCLVPLSEPTSSAVDVWAICAQYARRASERGLL